MSGWIVVLGVMLAAIGGWTVTHPDGGYRATGGAGSGFSAETRRAAGWVLLLIGAVAATVGGIALIG